MEASPLQLLVQSGGARFVFVFLVEIGFKSVACHPCLLIRIIVVAGEYHIVVIGIFVDDLLVTGNLLAAIEAVKAQMGNLFKFTD